MSTEFDSYASDYQKKIDESLGVFGKKHAYFIRDKVERLLKSFSEVGPLQELNILDVGCGIGLGHSDIAKQVHTLHGVDVSEKSIELATGNNTDVSYKTYEGGRLPYDDNSFDCTYAIGVLHHMPKSEWQNIVIEMKRIIRPGGQVLIIEHNPLNPATLWVVKTCDLDKNAILLAPWTLRRLFKKAHFQKLKLYYILLTPFSQAFFRALDRLFSRLPLGAQYIVKGTK